MVSSELLVATVRSVVPDAEVHPVDLTGGGDHWYCAVVAASFEGKRSFQRQRPILDAFTPAIQSGAVHALDLKCLTPKELEQDHQGRVPDPFRPHADGTPGMHRH